MGRITQWMTTCLPLTLKMVQPGTVVPVDTRGRTRRMLRFELFSAHTDYCLFLSLLAFLSSNPAVHPMAMLAEKVKVTTNAWNRFLFLTPVPAFRQDTTGFTLPIISGILAIKISKYRKQHRQLFIRTRFFLCLTGSQIIIF